MLTVGLSTVCFVAHRLLTPRVIGLSGFVTVSFRVSLFHWLLGEQQHKSLSLYTKVSGWLLKWLCVLLLDYLGVCLVPLSLSSTSMCVSIYIRWLFSCMRVCFISVSSFVPLCWNSPWVFTALFLFCFVGGISIILEWHEHTLHTQNFVPFFIQACNSSFLFDLPFSLSFCLSLSTSVCLACLFAGTGYVIKTDPFRSLTR